LASNPPEIKFGSIDGEAFAWVPGEAWVAKDGGSWVPVNSSIVGMDGRVLSKAAFAAKFPSLPPLPRSSFHFRSAAWRVPRAWFQGMAPQSAKRWSDMEESLDGHILEAIKQAPKLPPKPPYQPTK
jgi:hypothetical protein